MRTIAIINQKGGCGKTTTAINLAAVLAELGQRTLLVDLDPQAHCAAGLAIPASRIDFDIGDAMLHAADHGLDGDRLLWRVSKNLDLAPSRTKLAGLEASRGGLASASERERRLKRVLEHIAARADGAGGHVPFAYAVIDCPPSIGLLAYNAITAADEIIIPVETSFFSLQGATRQVATIRSLARRLGTRPAARLLATMHDHEHDLARDLHAELERRFKGALIPVTIRHDPAVREAASFGQPVTEYSPASMGAHDYKALGAWIHDQTDAGRVDAVTIEVKQTDIPMGARRKDRGRTAFGRAKPLHPNAGAQGRAPSEPGQAGTEPDNAHTPERTPERATDRAGSTATRPIPAGAAPVSDTEAKAISTISRVEDLCRRAQALHDRIRPEPARAEPESTRLHSADGTVRLVERPIDRTKREKSVGRLFGARRTGESLLFVQPLELGVEIRIAGDFNGWSAQAHPMQRNESMGVHELAIRVMPGRYRYRLIVDGAWREDQFNAHTEPNEFGETNNIVE